MLTDHYKRIATFIHLSTFTRLVIPLGNYLAPLILWILNKDKSEFIDEHGKQAINFQFSILLYTIIISIISIPFSFFDLFDHYDFHLFRHLYFSLDDYYPSFLALNGYFGALQELGFLLEFVFVISASLKSRNGETYQYPLSYKFIK